MGDDDFWFKPVWEDDDEPSKPLLHQTTPVFKPSGPSGAITAIATAEDVISRLDASCSVCHVRIRNGLIARLAYREAAGWLTSITQWIHPNDLALRDIGLTGSFSAAALIGNLSNELPNTIGNEDQEDYFGTLPEDHAIDIALNYARFVKRIALFKTWNPLSSLNDMIEVMSKLGLDRYTTKSIYEIWSDTPLSDDQPKLVYAIKKALVWRELDQEAHRGYADLRCSFIMAALMKSNERLRTVVLPIWSGQPILQSRLNSESPFVKGEETVNACLKLIIESVHSTSRELLRLSDIHESLNDFIKKSTSRSKMPTVIDILFKYPILTPKALTNILKISDRSATGLLSELMKAKLIRESTGRKSYRGFLI